MPDLGLRWPNAEKLALAWLRTRTTATVYTETDTDLGTVAADTGVLVVQRTGGSGGPVPDKDVDIEVTAYAGSRPALWALVGDVETAMSDLAGDGNTEGYVDDVAEAFSFAQEPLPTPGVWRAVATYSLTFRPL